MRCPCARCRCGGSAARCRVELASAQGNWDDLVELVAPRVARWERVVDGLTAYRARKPHLLDAVAKRSAPVPVAVVSRHAPPSFRASPRQVCTACTCPPQARGACRTKGSSRLAASNHLRGREEPPDADGPRGWSVLHFALSCGYIVTRLGWPKVANFQSAFGIGSRRHSSGIAR